MLLYQLKGVNNMIIEIIYSEERKTWNLFVNNEWYAEGTWEYIEQMRDNLLGGE